MMPNKLPPLPDALFNQRWVITIDKEGVSEDGESLTDITVSPMCIYSGKSFQVMNAEKQLIRLEGKLIAKGDLFPENETVATGTAVCGSRKHKIYRCERPLNPDGSVYVTILELM